MLLIGEGAENFAFSRGWNAWKTISSPRPSACCAAGGESGRGDYPRPPRRPRSMNARKWAPSARVALDLAGNLAAATSTGGMTNKLPGRVGDSPLPGAGCCCQQCQRGGLLHRHRRSFYAHLAAYDIAALMEYGQLSLYTACERVVMEKLPALGSTRRADCRRSRR